MDMNKHIKDGIFLGSLYIVMMLFAIFVPSVSLLLILFMPIPFLVYASRHNTQLVLMMVAATALVVFVLTILMNNLLIPPLFILTVAGGVAIGTSLFQRKTPYETWIQGTIGFVFGLLFVFLFTQLVLDVNWADEIDLVIEDSLAMTKDVTEQFGLTEQTEEQFEMIEEQMAVLKDLIPAWIALFAVGLAFLTQWFGYRILSQLENRRLRFPPVRQLRFPVFVVWIYIIAFVVTLFESDATSVIYIGAQNILTLAGFLMILQGFSFIFFYAHHKNKSNVLPIIAVILSVLLPFLLYIVVRIIGLIDMGFGLRNYMQNGKRDKKG